MRKIRQRRFRISGNSETFTTLTNQFKRAYSYSARHRLVNCARRNGMQIELEYQNGYFAHLTSGREAVVVDIRNCIPKEVKETEPKLSMRRQPKIKLR